MELKRVCINDEELATPKGVCWCTGTNFMDLITLFKSCVGEEVEEAVKRALLPLMVSLPLSSSRSSPHQAETSAARRLQLHFVGTFPDSLLTLTDIQDEGASLKVELCDDSGSRIEDGPESSIKIMIVVLDGDFEVEDRDYPTDEDFHKNVVKQRKGRRPLLVGECEISLSKGVGDISNIMFTDNSNWMRSGKFRLGALVVKGLPPGVVVRPAVSKAFKVKERRLQSYRKHERPILGDHVWRLDNIAKNGPICQRLAIEKVFTVRDFLELYHVDAKKLQDILRVSEKKWLKIVKNAQSCSLSNECYTYCDNATGVCIWLNSVFEIINVKFEGQSRPYGTLDDSSKEFVDKLRISAYENRSELQKVLFPTNQISWRAEPVIPSSTNDTHIHCLDVIATDKGSELQNNYAPTSISDRNMQFQNASAYSKQWELEKNCGLTNQMSLQADSAYPSTFKYTDMQCLGAKTADQGKQMSISSSSPTTFSFDGFQHGALFSEDIGTDNFFSDLFITPLEEEGGTIFEASTTEKVTVKLKAACYVTKAALRFMISVQQDQSAPRKKQKFC